MDESVSITRIGAIFVNSIHVIGLDNGSELYFNTHTCKVYIKLPMIAENEIKDPLVLKRLHSELRDHIEKLEQEINLAKRMSVALFDKII